MTMSPSYGAPHHHKQGSGLIHGDITPGKEKMPLPKLGLSGFRFRTYRFFLYCYLHDLTVLYNLRS